MWLHSIDNHGIIYVIIRNVAYKGYLIKYSIEWVTDEKRTILCKFNDSIVWNDFHIIIGELHEEIKKQAHPVDAIIWHKGNLPEGNPMVHFRSVINRQPDNLRAVILVHHGMQVGIGKFVQILSNVLKKLLPDKLSISFVTSIDEAYQHLDIDLTSINSTWLSTSRWFID